MTEKLACEMENELISLREELHMYPETDFCENKTSAIIRGELDKLNIPYTVMAKTGICALITGKNDGKTVLLRADMDGLPILEENDLPYKSKNIGYMHACGHDVHTTCLIGAAKILCGLKDKINGNVKLIFQPAEEGVGGALPMINEGAMENPKADAAFALHVEPLEKVGNIQVKDGAIMASPDEFVVKIRGKGGHGSAPEQCIDPIQIAVKIAQECKNIPKKYINPDIRCVVSVCSIHSGTCPNVIPETAVLEGTIRAFDNETRSTIASKLEEMTKEIATSSGGQCDFEYRALYPPVINNAEMNKVVEKAAREISLVKNIVKLDKAFMAGDDFSYFAERVPASYFRLGVGNDIYSAPIHSAKFNIDNKSIVIGTSIMAQIALDFLNS